MTGSKNLKARDLLVNYLKRSHRYKVAWGNNRLKEKDSCKKNIIEEPDYGNALHTILLLVQPSAT